MSEPTTPSTRAVDSSALGLIVYSITVLTLGFGTSGIIKEPGEGFFTASALIAGIILLLLGWRSYNAGDALAATTSGSLGMLFLSWRAATGAMAGDVHKTYGLFLLFWAIVSLFVTLAVFKESLASLVTWASWTLALLFLALGQFQNGTAPDSLTKVGGYLALVSGVVALYTAGATVVNAVHQKQLLPIR